MIFKSHILEENLQSTDNLKAFLFYGENDGLKKEFKEKIKTQNKSGEVIMFFQDEILKNKNTLIKEIENKSLFNEKKTIFIEQATDKILDIINEIINSIHNEKIILFSGILDKKSKLRSYFEKSKECGVSACYKDNEINIKKIISNKLKGYQGLNSQLLNLLVQNSGLDRNKINNEIDKIISCFVDKKIDLTKVDSLLNVKSNEDFNILKDEALNGNKNSTNRLLADTVFEPEHIIYYLNIINQRINKLNEIEELKKNNSNLETLISNLRPPIFWKEKSTIIEQSKKWNKIKIKKALKETYNTEVQIKSNSAIRKDLLIKNLIVDLCSVANSA